MGWFRMVMVKIDLCGTQWTIVEDEYIDDDGECDFNTQTIRINPTRHPHRRNLALTHELLHVIFDYVGLQDDEQLVGSLEHHIYNLIKLFPEAYK